MLKFNIMRAMKAKEFQPLDILVIGATHERYEQQLAKTGHNFYCVNDSIKQWDMSYGNVPENYNIFNTLPMYVVPDLILTHLGGSRLQTALAYSQMFSAPVIRHTHTLPENQDEYKNFNTIRPHIETFISDYSLNAWSPQAESFVINHGLDTNFWLTDFERTNKQDNVLSVVNYWQSRDWACGWELYRNVKNSLPDIKFKVLGKNPGLSKPAESISALRHELQDCSIFLNTSQHSPIPMSLLEAMACGCAVVSTNTCMIPNYVEHNVSGLLANNKEEMVQYVKQLQNDPEERMRLGRNARRVMENKFNITNFTNRWNGIFKHAISTYK